MKLICLLKHSWKRAASFGHRRVEVLGFECSRCKKRKLRFMAFAADFVTPMEPKIIDAAERWRYRKGPIKPAIRLVKND